MWSHVIKLLPILLFGKNIISEENKILHVTETATDLHVYKLLGAYLVNVSS